MDLETEVVEYPHTYYFSLLFANCGLSNKASVNTKLAMAQREGLESLCDRLKAYISYYH